MPWQKVRFKDKDVWAEVDEAGQPKVSGGRVPIRYSPREGAKIYGGSISRVTPIPGEGPQELPEGVSADSGGGSGGGAKKGGQRGSGFGSAGKRSASQAAAAARYSREMIDALPEGTHLAFTDGACKGNPGPAGAGAVVKLADGRVLEASRSCGIATNNVGELTAIGMAVELLEEGGVPTDAPVALFTDSQYAMGVLTLGWKAKANMLLIRQLKAKLKPWSGLQVNWIAGHVGIEENERADRLAAMGSEQARR